MKAYIAYLKLDRKRSLCKLWVAGGKRSPAIATLKRWSARYGWVELAAIHDELVADQMSSIFIEQLGSQNFPDMGVITIAKHAFYNRIARDIQQLATGGKNPKLSLKINVRDYVRLVRLERELHAEAIPGKNLL